jgi:hypothetical protein
MYFEAELRDKKYKIEVFETSSNWKISLQQEDQAKEIFTISKIHYQRMDDAISFIFKNSSYDGCCGQWH